MNVPVTSLYAALAVLLLIALAARVSPLRRRHRVGLGTGGEEVLSRAVRAHGNAAENIPVAILLLLLLELQGTATALLHIFGGSFLLSRFLHAWGLSQSSGLSFGRFYGMILTWLAMLGMVGALIWKALEHLI
jgi:uncharacterized membrane protein YecN with MAPEG domain